MNEATAKERNPSDIVLSYEDCLLRRADVQLLQGPHWLNDAIIGFYFEYLNARLGHADRKKLLFVSPELTQLLKLTDPSDYDSFLEPLDAKNKEFLFFPLNNCGRRDKGGGSHWSLLVYSRPEETCFHYDSLEGSNATIARDFARKLTSHLLGTTIEAFKETDGPRQRNGYDCGLFVLCLADLISVHACHKAKIIGCKYDGIENVVVSKREKVLKLIEDLGGLSLTDD